MSRIPWNKFETALLIDTYLAVDEKKQPRKNAVKSLSQLLRAMGEMNGVDVDEIYRNENGISMRLYEIERLFHDGRGGLKNTSKLFVEMVEMYKNGRNGFNQILKEAKRMSDHAVSKKVLFAHWLQEQTDLREDVHVIVDSLDAISVFAEKHKMSKHSIWEMSEPNEIDAICATLLRSYLFKHFHRGEAKQLPYYSKCFQGFLEALKDENNGHECETIVADSLFQEITDTKVIDATTSNEKSVVADGRQDYSIHVESSAFDTECDESPFDIEDLDDVSEFRDNEGAKTEKVPGENNQDIESKEKTEPVNKRTIVDAVVTVMEKENRAMTVSEIYNRIIEEDLYTFGAKEPEQVVAKQIKRACRDSHLCQKTSNALFGLTQNECGKNCYFLLSREKELQQSITFPVNNEKTNPEYIRTATDVILHEKYAVIFKRIYTVMKDFGYFSVSEDEVQEKIGRIGRLSTVKFILDHASWSDHKEEGKYTFSEIPIEYIIDENQENKNKIYQKLHSISRVYDDPAGFSISKIMTILGEKVDEEMVRDILEEAPWARKLSET